LFFYDDCLIVRQLIISSLLVKIRQGEPGSHKVSYTEDEVCFLLEGKVIVHDSEGSCITLNKGDMLAMLPVACCLLPVACCLLPVACCLLPVACCLLPVAFCLLPFAFCLLPFAF
jgi:hypothetical protein